MAVIDEVKQVLRDALQLGDRTRSFDASTRLLGSLPEFDSMAVVGLVGALEEHFDIEIDDDDITADSFETLGSLAAMVAAKAGG